MDAENQVLHGGYVYAENGEILRVGSGAAGRLPTADRVIDGRHCDRHPRPGQYPPPSLPDADPRLCSRGQRRSSSTGCARCTRSGQGWTRSRVHVAALAGMAELMLSGCTTTSDHHYLFPRGRSHLIDAQIEAARRIGIRFHPTRGSMSVGRQQGRPAAGFGGAERRADSAGQRAADREISRSAPRLHAAPGAGSVFAVFRIAGVDAGDCPTGPPITACACIRTWRRPATRRRIV